ncbi:MAG TPA: hypothetical protein VLM85_02495 [Polyangiaceae bacterium]|nr:hypothetical protein [Polyangiaceae bacterium]
MAVSSVASAQAPSGAKADEPAPSIVTLAPCTVLPQPGTPCAMSGGRATTIRVARIGVELVLGTLFGAGLGALGAYAGLNADLAAGNESGVGLGLGTSFGVALGVAPGVWLGGRAMGGDGSFGWTLLGSAVGTGISAAMLAANSQPGMLFLGATIPVSLSILAFELSSHTRKEAQPSPAKPPSARVIPSLGPRFVGVVGTF